MNTDNIIAIKEGNDKEGNDNLLVKVRDGERFEILLFEDLTKQKFMDNIHIVSQKIANHNQYQPIAKFCGDIFGWEMGLKFLDS